MNITYLKSVINNLRSKAEINIELFNNAAAVLIESYEDDEEYAECLIDELSIKEQLNKEIIFQAELLISILNN